MIQEASKRTKRRRHSCTEEQPVAMGAECGTFEEGLMEFCLILGVSPGSVSVWRRRVPSDS
jgi:hypothetical protein